MRRLVIVCRPQDSADIRARVREYAHPGVVDAFVAIKEVDVDVADSRDTALEIMNEGHSTRVPSGATNPQPFVAATKEIGNFLKMGKSAYGIHYEEHAATKLRKLAGNRKECLVWDLLQTCGLTVVPAAAYMLRTYAHTSHVIDASAINSWIGQFRKLKVEKYGLAILRQIRLMEQSVLGTLLADAQIPDGAAICVNRDATTSGKSEAVVSNLVLKRAAGGKVFDSPKDAVDAGHTKIAIFEDGLWTATELIGVLQSMLGMRTAREKTPALTDLSRIGELDFTLVFGVATDYGLACLDLFLRENNLSNIRVIAGQKVSVTGEVDVLAAFSSTGATTAELRRLGPPAEIIRPAVFSATALTSPQEADMKAFCEDVGRQLFVNYIQIMKERRPDYKDWPAEKLDRCSLGMWGFGMTFAFAHSVPKASLPLLWSEGEVTWRGATVSKWTPLFPNVI
ncbi:hypothetical protein SAMN05192548_101517 [Paraburkholderia terricola]|uniref:PRTase-CE domain-containing protein n=1 Tax=Paraburkholderia terricola TaxID=169427 RepID=A0A1M6QA76_9BURK|nr:hypothetical protein SAMN05192547_1009166 [Paraburkholderia sediminicola]SHK17040.1 hypothetical protein SAMN05192548_101517 [Paraburkholderia terricola]